MAATKKNRISSEMYFRRLWRTTALVAILCLAAQPAAAIDIQLDFTYDTSNFFGTGNPSGPAAGAQAKAALQSAASYYSTILTDSFSTIQTPGKFHSNQGGGDWTWQWTENFNDPTTNNPVVVTDATIAANQYVVYAGARSLSASEAGLGGPGAAGWSSTPVGQFTPQEINQNNQITTTFINQVEKRGQGSGFASWGGTVTFDNDGSTTWFYNHLGTPSGSVYDFYSAAIHELGHALGLGTSTEWQALVSGSGFIGANADALNHGNAVPLAPGLDHWAAGTNSRVYGTTTAQEAAMDPDLLNGTRKKLTELDAAGLKDIGWSLGPPPASPAVNGDYNGNGVVDAGDYAMWRKRLNQNVTLPNDTTPGTVTAADYTIWRSNFGKTAAASGSGGLLAGGEVPEPATGLLALISAICVYFNRPRRRLDRSCRARLAASVICA